jgi:ANTAR domain
MLLTPFRVASRTGYPSYAGVVTHWWTGRASSESDAVIADLMVKHLIALVDHERLMVAVARAEDQAANLALEAISGRTINLATGIVMHQYGLAPDDAEDLLRRSAKMAGKGLAQMAASVVRSGALVDSAASHSQPGPVVRGLSLVSSPSSRFLPASGELA